MGFTTNPQTGDAIITATRTLPTLSPTQTTLTASATICTFYDYPSTGRWFTAEYMINNASGDNIVNLFFAKLNGVVRINGVRLDVPPYNYDQDGVPEDFDFVMDFDADTVDLYVNDALLIADVAMNADYSASDVAQVAARVVPYTQNGYQGIMYIDNLMIWEDAPGPPPPPSVMELLAATDSNRIALEFDAYNPLNPNNSRWQELGYRLRDGSGTDLFHLLVYNTTDDIYRLNGVDIPNGPWTTGWNHYKLDIDFVADTVDLYINYEATPRLSDIALGTGSEDFEPTDIAFLALDAIVNWDTVGVTNFVDNIELYDNRDWNCPDGDVTGDCQVDYEDISLIADNWLESDDPNSP
jgi:hypothetical protein